MNVLQWKGVIVKTAVVICSANRPDVLSQTVDSLIHGQSVPPHEIVVSVCSQEHVAERTRAESTVRIVLSSKQGTSVQRNMAAKSVRTPYTLFLDDDVEIAPNFIESMECLLERSEDAIAATGFVVVDGVRWDTGLGREEAKAAALNYVRRHENRDCEEGYGCNLFVRTRVFDEVLFDENLSLYGWLEDLDFSINCRRYGRMILNAETCVAHLATPGGRTSGLRFGYSQIVNPFYLWRKNGEPSLRHIIYAHWSMHVVRNVRRMMVRIPSDRSDRTGRFKGNVIGFCHLLTGKVDPSYIHRL
jgi:polysaccharide biosynthesis transport protein